MEGKRYEGWNGNQRVHVTILHVYIRCMSFNTMEC